MKYVAGDGLELELRPREMTGPLPLSARWGLRWIWGFYALSALPLLTFVACSVVTAMHAGSYLLGRGFPWTGTPGVDRTNPLLPGVWPLLGGALLWLLVALVVWFLGFALALATRSIRHWATPIVLILVLPFATSVLVAGVAWRSLVDPVHGLFPAPDVLGSWTVWPILITAFAWTWIGFTVSLFRAALDAIDHSPADRLRFEEQGPLGKLRMLAPVNWVLLLTLAVASTRIFELVLIMVPSVGLADIGAPAVHWWRMDVANIAAGPAAVIALVLFGFAGVYGAVAFLFTRPDRPLPLPYTPPEAHSSFPRSSRWEPRSWLSLCAGALAAVLVLMPIGLLCFHAFWRNPTNTEHGPNLESWAQVLGPGLGAGLGNSMLVTGVVATIASTTTLIAAIGLAYLLNSRLPDWVRNVYLALLVLLTLAPVQMFVVPFRQMVEQLGLGGTKIPLILLHVAVFLPYATLVLHSALGMPKHQGSSDLLFGLTGSTTTVDRLAERVGPAMIAVFVLQWVLVWNDFLLGFLLHGPGASPVTVLLWGEARQFSVSIGPVSAGALLASLPPVLLVLFTWRRWVVPGLTRGLLR